MFKQLLPNAEDWEMVIYEHSNHVSPTVWAHRLHDVDVFLSTHGFQMALLYFLPRPSIVLEVFPHHYYKVVYERLAIGIGLAHDYWISEPITLFQSLLYGLISPKACINFLPCRMFARNTNVR